MPEESESAEALRAVAEDVTGDNIVVMSVDLITDVRLEVHVMTSGCHCRVLKRESSNLPQACTSS